jgi:protein involved in polysaccharide export with SLBB domain
VAAIAAAGGPTERAELRKVTLVRRGVLSSMTTELNFEKYLKEGLMSANPEVRAGDTIMVPARKTWLSSFFSPTVLTAMFSAVVSIILITTS